MPTTVSLQNNFKSGLILILFLFIILVSPLFINLIKRIKARRNDNAYKRAYETGHAKPLPFDIKDEYIKKLTALRQSIDDNRITVREGYLGLSSIIREFVLKYEGIDVTNKTLAELRANEIPELVSLIEEYYEPEFSEKSGFDYRDSIQKTIKVISKWK